MDLKVFIFQWGESESDATICAPVTHFPSDMLIGDKQGALEFLKLIFRALCLCWDRQTQDLHIDWVLFRGRSLIPVSCEVVNDNIDGYYPSSHYPIFAEFMLPRTVRLIEPPTREEN